jgi:hypothetical protein
LSITLVGCELVQPSGLAIILGKATTAILIKEPETDLPPSISVLGGELEEARRFRIGVRPAVL